MKIHILALNVGDQEIFNYLTAQWYRALEEEGEVMFTHKFISEGMRLVDIDYKEKFCNYYGGNWRSFCYNIVYK